MNNETIIKGLTRLFKQKANQQSKALKSKDIIDALAKDGIVIKSNKLRAIIGDMRQQDILNPAFIVSSVDDGYWLTDNTAELDQYIERQLYRMCHQYDNIQALHQRQRSGRGKRAIQPQQMIFAL